MAQKSIYSMPTPTPIVTFVSDCTFPGKCPYSQTYISIKGLYLQLLLYIFFQESCKTVIFQNDLLDGKSINTYYAA